MTVVKNACGLILQKRVSLFSFCSSCTCRLNEAKHPRFDFLKLIYQAYIPSLETLGRTLQHWPKLTKPPLITGGLAVKPDRLAHLDLIPTGATRLTTTRHTNRDCHFYSSDSQKYLFSSPSEICHWNSTVWDSYSSSESSEDSSEVLSPSVESSQGFHDSLDAYIMEHSKYRRTSSGNQWSPGAVSESMPESFQNGAWLDSQLSGNAPFSPVLSDFTLPTSETSFTSLEPATTQDFPMIDTFASANWSAELTDRSYIDESAVSEQSMFPFNGNVQPDVAPGGYPSWFSPSDVAFENYFPVDQTQGHVPGFSTVAPQTAGFVGSAPAVQNMHTGPAYQTTGPATNGRFEPAPVANLQRGHYDGVAGLTSRAATGSFMQSLQSQEVGDSRQPRRLSVSVNPPVSWSGDVQVGPGYGPNLYRIPILQSQGPSNATVAASSSINSAYIKTERSLSASSPISTRARSEESEGKPRSHRYYTTARPHADGYYHCPYVGSDKCPHKPTKLKCNYDKYIDSHLKPFVCKQDGCRGTENENRFSSTACLLRHEREAHGLHGHGNKPYLCQYDGCERSIPGNGFPRNYNLMDHMKRVHRHNPEDKAPSPPGSSSGTRGSKMDTSKIRKKKPEGPKRTLTGSSTSGRRRMTSPAPTLAGQDWSELNACKDKLQQQLRRAHDYNPREAAIHTQQMKQEIPQRFR